MARSRTSSPFSGDSRPTAPTTGMVASWGGARVPGAATPLAMTRTTPGRRCSRASVARAANAETPT